jgi:WD40 repeat protein
MLTLGAVLLASVLFRNRVKTADDDAVVVLEVDQPGALVQVDGQDITVHVPGDNQPVEIKAEPGRHRLRISKQGFEVVTREVELKSGKSPPIRVRLEPAPAATASGADPRRSYRNMDGEWKVDGEELVQESTRSFCHLVFGDFTWKDYDVRVELKWAGGQSYFELMHHVTGAGNGALCLVGWENACLGHSSHRGRTLDLKRCPGGRLERGRWYRVNVRLRGGHCQCFVDDRMLFEYDDPQNTQGAVGLATGGAVGHFRNLRVTDAGGKILFRDWPTLPPVAGQWRPPTEPASPGALRCLTGHGAPVTCVTFSRDGRRVLSSSNGEAGRHLDTGAPGTSFWWEGGPGSTHRLWDADTGEQVASSPLVQPLAANQRFVKLAQAVAGPGFLSLTAPGPPWNQGPKRVQLWNRAGNQLEPQFLFQLASPGAIDLAFTPDGRKALVVGAAGGLWEWDLHERVLTRRGPDNLKDVSCVAIAPDARLALLARRNAPFAELDLGSRTETGRWKQAGGVILSLAFAGDAPRAVSGGEDGLVRLWDVAEGKHVRVIWSHLLPVRAVALSPDGRRALSGGDDRTVRLWDVDGPNELARFTGHTGTVQAVAFSPDGRRAASGSADYTVRLWQLPP